MFSSGKLKTCSPAPSLEMTKPLLSLWHLLPQQWGLWDWSTPSWTEQCEGVDLGDSFLLHDRVVIGHGHIVINNNARDNDRFDFGRYRCSFCCLPLLLPLLLGRGLWIRSTVLPGSGNSLSLVFTNANDLRVLSCLVSISWQLRQFVL